MSEQPKKSEIAELTGLRGLAALLIIINHLVLVLPCIRKTDLCYYTTQCGVFGMSLFFVLSGIVIYYNYADRLLSSPGLGIRQFLLARFARLYPLYFVFILSFFIVNLFRYPELAARHISSLPLFLAGLQSWIYGYIDGTEIVYLQAEANISWSISTEFALYFLFVPVVFVLGKLDARKALGLFAMVFVLRFVFLHVVYGLDFPGEWLDKVFPGHPDAVWAYLVYRSPIGRFFEFLSGCAIAGLYLNLQGRSPGRPWVVFSYCAWFLSAAIVVCIVFKLFSFSLWDHTMITPCVMLFCLGLPALGGRILRWRPLVFLGEVSYSAYLLHIVFVILLHYGGSNWHSITGTLIGFVVLTYVTAFLAYRYFEMPARRAIRKFFMGK